MPESVSHTRVRPLFLSNERDRQQVLERLGYDSDRAALLSVYLDVPTLLIERIDEALRRTLEALPTAIRLILSPDGSTGLLLGSAGDIHAAARGRDLGRIGAAVAVQLSRMGAPPDFTFVCGRHILPLGRRTHVMGILNVTPDSFSDGGLYLGRDDALRQAERLLAEGADILDIGGESSRPAGPYGKGAQPVDETEETQRTAPVIEAVVREFDCVVSIDTVKSGVARAAIDAGATLVNDISALRGDPEMAGVVARSGLPTCLMHMKGTPGTMQRSPRYADLLGEIYGFLEERIAAAHRAGIAPDRILIDPGIGFGKTHAHNFTLLRRLSEFHGLGCPILAGASRKGFLGVDLDLPPAERLEGTIASHALCISGGAHILRVHDVAAARRAARVTESTLWPASSPVPQNPT